MLFFCLVNLIFFCFTICQNIEGRKALILVIVALSFLH